MKKWIFILALGAQASCDQAPWSEEEQSEFMEQCMAETEDERYCSCYMNNVMEKYPQAEDSEEMSFEEAYEFSKDCQ